MARELSNPPSSPSDDAQLLPSAASAISRIREVLLKARHQALAAVNSAMVQAYWEVGREIVEEEQRGQARAGYGQRLLESLSASLSDEFGKGFDASNLRNMRQFYLSFPIRDALRPDLSWMHYRLLSRVDRAEARAFYENVTTLRLPPGTPIRLKESEAGQRLSCDCPERIGIAGRHEN